MILTVNIDDETATNAEAIYDALGIDLETAVKMFLKRTVLEQRLPLDTRVQVTQISEKVPAKNESMHESNEKRTNNVITKKMARDVWRRFENYAKKGGDINLIAADVHRATGMNQGSAFIYLTILDNFVKGKPNTRNMKMADLEYYVEQIRNYLGEQSYLNTLKSLKASIPYWDKEVFGQFATKVQIFIDGLEKE